ncbi:MAG: 50S ribosomal protein L9 [Alphaproteobacteria bacterium]|nr:50S ribosomal protein L9 [Alphaproteobacteria bacterium]
MQVILLERVQKLGQMGDVVTVRPGYARNFLLPQGKALRATKANVTYFEAQKKVLEADNLKKKGEAEKIAKKMDGTKVAIIRSASEAGHLYGSVSARDIADAITAKGFTVTRQQVRLDRAYKELGLYPVEITLHPEVGTEVTINIARSEEEAKIQEKKGGALIVTDDEAEEKAAAPKQETEQPETPTEEATDAEAVA